MIKGGDQVDIIMSAQVVVSFNIPPMSVDEFFDGKNIIKNLALLLNIPESK